MERQELVGAILEQWSEWIEEQGINKDTPSCMRCGKSYEEFEVGEDCTGDERANAWSNSPLFVVDIDKRILKKQGQQAHNAFLLCDKCKNEIPNVKTINAFLKWAKRSDHIGVLIGSVESVIKISGKRAKTQPIINILKSPEFKAYVRERDVIDAESGPMDLIKVWVDYIDEHDVIENNQVIDEIRYLIENKDGLDKKSLVKKYSLNLKKIGKL